MAFSTPLHGDQAVALQVQERLKAVYGLIHEIENARQQTEKNLDKIPEKSTDERGNAQSQQQRLKTLYSAVADTEREVCWKILCLLIVVD